MFRSNSRVYFVKRNGIFFFPTVTAHKRCVTRIFICDGMHVSIRQLTKKLRLFHAVQSLECLLDC